MYSEIRDLIIARKRQDALKEPAGQIIPGVISSLNGSVTYAELGPNFSWVRAWSTSGPLHPALNLTATRDAGSPIWIARDPQARSPFDFQVIGPRFTAIDDFSRVNLSLYNIQLHNQNHMAPTESGLGVDPVWIFQPALMMLKTVGDGATLTIKTYPYIYTKNGAPFSFGGQETDLTSYVPGAGLVRRVLVYFDRDSNTLEFVSGDTVIDNGIIPIPYPMVPGGIDGRESAWVTLANGQSTITTATDVVDGRDFLDTGDDDPLPEPTEQGQILFADENLRPFWALPVTDSNGYIVTDSEGKIVVT